MQKIDPFLWFDGKAEDAANFYVSVFREGRILDTKRFPEGGPGEPGSVLTVEFEIFGQRFVALNGGPHYSFTPAISFFVHCRTQAEVDLYWEKLLDGGTPVQCGWITDKYGVSWQIVPEALDRLMHGPDRESAKRVMQAMLQMVKLDVAALEKAHAGAS